MPSNILGVPTSGMLPSSSSANNKQKKIKDYQGRIYIFTQKELGNDTDYLKIKEIVEQSGGDVSEIKVEGKPYLIALMKKIVGDLKPPHVFFNDEYIGGLEEIKNLKESGLLTVKIQTCKNALTPGELYKVYRKQGDLFVISPNHLYFPPPSKRLITCCITLYNRTDKYTAYKLKTTCPNRYIVKPKKGIAPPNGTAQVEITMQKPVTTDEKGDKFRVESLALQYYKPEMEDQVDELFKEAEERRVVKQKISCRFEAPPTGFTVSNNEDGSITVKKSQSSVDIFDGFPIDQFSQAVKKQIEINNSKHKPQFNIPVSTEAKLETVVSATSPLSELIFESPRNFELPKQYYETPTETEKSPVTTQSPTIVKSTSNDLASPIADEESNKLEKLKSSSEKIVQQKTQQKAETSKGLEELYKEEYNRLEKEYDQIINKLKTSEQRVKECELTIDSLNERLRESEQNLEKERAKKRVDVSVLESSLGNRSTLEFDEKNGYSLIGIIAVALICLLIGKLMP
ncbi:major sperm protein-like protein [Naegleria gruberi]|uniref:Major sperm protein-like protein n=1 Tax=Naegleria gruberi TaxID=5762 RepID=D2VIR8_NAEGR|nr:major sperm protein-like protein [Naegleria gruberi]EFC43322.1 major sperm protein-like protein [Naegleria gruberi]|eukprot:XP_002676066.1 major sperm protein-like protein [Naegleria gruberi strain NEG-M]